MGASVARPRPLASGCLRRLFLERSQCFVVGLANRISHSGSGRPVANCSRSCDACSGSRSLRGRKGRGGNRGVRRWHVELQQDAQRHLLKSRGRPLVDWEPGAGRAGGALAADVGQWGPRYTIAIERKVIVGGVVALALIVAGLVWYFAVYDTAENKCSRGDLGACVVVAGQQAEASASAAAVAEASASAAAAEASVAAAQASASAETSAAAHQAAVAPKEQATCQRVGGSWGGAVCRIDYRSPGVSIRLQAERAIASVVEAECPLCHTELRIHDGRACCPCCGDSYRVGVGHLEAMRCPVHGRHCEHWQAIWSVKGIAAPQYVR
jgi:hypothetical protein